jgi:hypothetical protein
MEVKRIRELASVDLNSNQEHCSVKGMVLCGDGQSIISHKPARELMKSIYIILSPFKIVSISGFF